MSDDRLNKQGEALVAKIAKRYEGTIARLRKKIAVQRVEIKRLHAEARPLNRCLEKIRQLLPSEPKLDDAVAETVAADPPGEGKSEVHVGLPTEKAMAVDTTPASPPDAEGPGLAEILDLGEGVVIEEDDPNVGLGEGC